MKFAAPHSPNQSIMRISTFLIVHNSTIRLITSADQIIRQLLDRRSRVTSNHALVVECNQNSLCCLYNDKTITSLFLSSRQPELSIMAPSSISDNQQANKQSDMMDILMTISPFLRKDFYCPRPL